MLRLKYLFTGTGRNGSVYLARVFSSIGIMCGHECIFDYLGIDIALDRLKGKEPIKLSEVSSRERQDWFKSRIIQADSSYMAAPYLAHDCLKDTKIIHIVRHPLQVISSFLYDVEHFQDNPKTKLWDDFIISILPELKDIEIPLERACYFYTQWNMMIEPYSHILYKIEDDIKVLLSKLGIKYHNYYYEDKYTNSFGVRDRNITLEEIPEGKIKDDFLLMFQKYNYPVKNVPFVPRPKLYI